MKILKCVQSNLCWHVWVIWIDVPAMSAALSLLSAGSRSLLTHMAGDLPPEKLALSERTTQGQGEVKGDRGQKRGSLSTNGENVIESIIIEMSGGKCKNKRTRTRNKSLFPSIWDGWYIYCNFDWKKLYWKLKKILLELFCFIKTNISY